MSDTLKDAQETKSKSDKHTLSVQNRRQVAISGMTDVISFDENEVAVRTTAGKMRLEGSALKVVTLDTENGVLLVEGTLDGIVYSDDSRDTDKQAHRFLR